MDFGSNNKVKIEGGMASMTDLVFLLLIFFIIMSLMNNATMRVDLPQATEEIQPMPDKTTPTVVVTEQNLYVVFPGGDMDSPREFEEIVGEVESVVNNSEDVKLKIEGHRNANYESVFKVMAFANKFGWSPVLAYKK